MMVHISQSGPSKPRCQPSHGSSWQATRTSNLPYHKTLAFIDLWFHKIYYMTYIYIYIYIYIPHQSFCGCGSTARQGVRKASQRKGKMTRGRQGRDAKGTLRRADAAGGSWNHTGEYAFCGQTFQEPCQTEYFQKTVALGSKHHGNCTTVSEASLLHEQNSCSGRIFSMGVVAASVMAIWGDFACAWCTTCTNGAKLLFWTGHLSLRLDWMSNRIGCSRHSFCDNFCMS